VAVAVAAEVEVEVEEEVGVALPEQADPAHQELGQEGQEDLPEAVDLGDQAVATVALDLGLDQEGKGAQVLVEDPLVQTLCNLLKIPTQHLEDLQQ
jgi:hypothetical protein